ncbi:MAG: MFS transporter [Spirochaetaceae bacterium]|nr:MFS transporter [Spirochaetaceae bacterium]
MVNSFSWTLLTGNIITLFALRLKANSTTIGALSALIYVAFFFLPLGKLLAKWFSIIQIYRVTWILRSLIMIPLVFVPLVVSVGRQDLAMPMTLLGVLAFHMFRGIGMIGNNPVLSTLAAGPGRGSYMTQIQVINSAVGMFAGFAIAMLLGRSPPLFFYSIIFAAGIVSGIFSAVLLKGIPEPETSGGEGGGGFFSMLRSSWGQASFRRFIGIFFLVALISAVARAFLAVYSREAFSQGDGMVSLYSVFGGLGALMAGLAIKFLVDRIGVKPIYLVCVIIGLLGILPVIFFPSGSVENLTTVVPFLSFLHFIVNFGFLGSEGIAQTYFLALVPVESMLNMGIVYFFVFGLAGAGGSFLAGIFLDFCTSLGFSSFVSFKILYGLLVLMTLGVLILQRKLVSLGSLPFKGAMEVMFSIRDLRAITLLDRLDKTSDREEEEALLEALREAPSELAARELLDRARSPRLATRSEALRALDALETLNEEVERALIEDTISHPYTTAYISARALGNHRIYAAIPILRELSVSGDYMLAAEALIALAKLKDEAFRPEIEALILSTANPRLKIRGAEALGIYGSPHSLPTLTDLLRAADPPPYLKDTVILSMAAILGVQDQFYPLLVRFLGDESQITTLCMDEAESAFEYQAAPRNRKRRRDRATRLFLDKQAQALSPAVAAFAGERQGGLLSRWLLEWPDGSDTIARLVMAEAVLEDPLTVHGRFRLLAVYWAAQKLRSPAL